MTTALFIGRFQPFHLGHLSVVEQALQENDHLIIGIGSSQYSKKEDNPFTAEEREEMIHAALDEAGIPRNHYTLILIPDIHDDARWVDHVVSLVPPFKKIYTGSPIVEKLFKNHKKEKGGGIEIIPVKFLLNISATAIREKMKRGEEWSKDVPIAVERQIKAIRKITIQ